MPYSLPEDVGGDSKENTEWMELCVASIMKDGKTGKSSAIVICKSTLIKNKKKEENKDSEDSKDSE